MRRLAAAVSVTALAVSSALVAASVTALHAAPMPAPRLVASTPSEIRAIGDDLYSVSVGAWDRTWSDPINGIQSGDVTVRKFLPKAGGSTAAFAPAQTLDITTAPQSGHYLGQPSIFTVEGGLVMCRVNPPATDSGTTWWVDTALFLTSTGRWSTIKHDEITSIYGTGAACDGAVRRGNEYTVIVGQAQHGLNIGQSIYAVSRTGSAPAVISPFTNSVGRVPGARTSGSVSVSVNAATGVTDLYLGKRIPVTISVINSVTVGDVDKRISRSSFVMFDLDTHLWTTPKATFGSTYSASQDVIGETIYHDSVAAVSGDRQSLTLVNTFEKNVSIPAWPTFTGTSLTNSPADSRLHVLGLSAKDAARADFRSPLGWTLRYADGAGAHRVSVLIYQVRATSILLIGYNGASLDAIQGTARNVKLQFTGNPPGGDYAELEWTRAVKVVSYGTVARTWTVNGLSPEITLPGSWNGNGYAGTRIANAAVIDGRTVVITDDAGDDSRRTFNSHVLGAGGWSAPQLIARNVVSQDYPWASTVFLPYGSKTAIVTVQGPPAEANVTSIRASVPQGVVRRVFAGDQWGSLETLAGLPGAEVVGVPVYARVKGASGMVDVVIRNVHPTVPLTDVSYNADEHLDANPWATLTYRYAGRIPAGASGAISVWGWTDATGWTIGAQDPVIDASAHTIKVPTPIEPQTDKPSKPAFIMWYDVTHTLFSVN